MRSFSVIFIMCTVVVVGCSRSDDSLTTVVPGGSIDVTVTLFHSLSLPPRPVGIKLSKLSSNHADSAGFMYTSALGKALFTNIPNGTYLVAPVPDSYYFGGTTQSVTISTDTSDFRMRIDVEARYHFSTDTILVLVDTTQAATNLQNLFFNDGVQDTLVWSIDGSHLPAWLTLTPMNGVFPPQWSPPPTSSSYLQVGFQTASFPRTPWPVPIAVPFVHQYGRDTVYIAFVRIH